MPGVEDGFLKDFQDNRSEDEFNVSPSKNRSVPHEINVSEPILERGTWVAIGAACFCLTPVVAAFCRIFVLVQVLRCLEICGGVTQVYIEIKQVGQRFQQESITACESRNDQTISNMLSPNLQNICAVHSDHVLQ